MTTPDTSASAGPIELLTFEDGARIVKLNLFESDSLDEVTDQVSQQVGRTMILASKAWTLPLDATDRDRVALAAVHGGLIETINARTAEDRDDGIGVMTLRGGVLADGRRYPGAVILGTANNAYVPIEVDERAQKLAAEAVKHMQGMGVRYTL